jgi:S-adenosylmethionine decarboxylase
MNSASRHELGRHVLIDGWGCSSESMNDPKLVERAVLDSIREGGATLIDMIVHQFSPYGVTATAALAESHIAIHTWPEHGYFAADIFFCGELDPHKSVPAILQTLGSTHHEVREISRGMPRAAMSHTPVQDQTCRS